MMTTMLALLLAGGDARFEAAGVRLGEVLVTGEVMELRAGALVSGRVLESLAAPLRVEDVDGLLLVLEPGVRAAREAGGIRLSAHAPAQLRAAEAVGETLFVERTSTGWALEGKALTGELRVSTQAKGQDDPDAALRAMQESAKKMRESSLRIRPPQRRRVFGAGSPLVGSQAADSQAARQLSQLSLSGS